MGCVSILKKIQIHKGKSLPQLTSWGFGQQLTDKLVYIYPMIGWQWNKWDLMMGHQMVKEVKRTRVSPSCILNLFFDVFWQSVERHR